ncbi:NAD-dependent epimerase/dehydratase family protein [Paenibacillus sp. TY11]|uniref:NAD-dependent epimerase/dehydratase family protein n=1 Tax=Paenibacillus sp. TY11 TaxID=3448633 RepID=UPI004039A091
MKNVLIVGCGYLGSHIANYFDQQGWNVKIAGKKSFYVEHLVSTINFYEMDITNSDLINSIIEENDMVIYAAGSINATNKFEDIAQDVSENYLSFINLLNECSNKKISKFIFLSSAGTVYGDTDKIAEENDCLNPINIYGLQKVYCENLIKIKHYESNNLPYVILRISNPYGGIQNPHKNQGIIPVLIDKALYKEPFTFWGNVNSLRDFIYIDDFLAATYLSATTQINEVINIASGTCTSIQRVIDIVQQRVGDVIKIVYKKSNNKVLMNNRINNSKLIQLTGYSPLTLIEDGIFKMIKKSNIYDKM